MDNDSDLIWQQLQSRLDQRFGKYFRSCGEKNDLISADKKSRPEGHSDEIKPVKSFLSAPVDDV